MAAPPDSPEGDKPFLTEYEEPRKDEGEMPLGRVILDLFVKLAVVLGVAYASLYALRGLMSRQGALPGRRGALRVLESASLGPNRSVHLVRVGSKVLVVGSTQEHITALSEIDDPDTLAQIAASGAAPSFAASLDGALAQGDVETAPLGASTQQAGITGNVRDGIRHLWDQVQEIRGLRPPKGGDPR